MVQRINLELSLRKGKDKLTSYEYSIELIENFHHQLVNSSDEVYSRNFASTLDKSRRALVLRSQPSKPLAIAASAELNHSGDLPTAQRTC